MGKIMRTIIMNMVRIFNGHQVLVLDKKVVHGWEGLTFPGGKVEANESFNDAAIREIKEETNLDIKNLEFNGIIQWVTPEIEERLVGLLYTSRNFSGKLVTQCDEGKLFFEDYEEFKERTNKSDAMDHILDIYDGKYFEIILTYEGNQLLGESRY